MTKLFAALTSAVTLAVIPAAAMQAPAATTGSNTAERITVIGCVAKNGATEHDKGTRQLNTVPGGFALTDARQTMAGGGGSSAVPGSLPGGNDTGTIPQRDSVVGRAPTTDATTGKGYALSGKLDGLEQQIGRRVEVIGTVKAASSSTGGEAGVRGTTGNAPGTSVIQPETGTREERSAPASAHPSADLVPLDVISFRPVTGICQ